MNDLRSSARMLGGEVSGGRIRCPGPGHSKHDRSMWITFDWQAPDGFIVGSFAGDPFDLCRDHVRRVLGIEPWSPQKSSAEHRVVLNDRIPSPKISNEEKPNRDMALALFKAALPVTGTIAETYLRKRGATLFPSALRFHPRCFRSRENHPAIVALMHSAITNEPQAIQRIFLKPDGSDRLRDDRGKMTLGPAAGAVVKLTPDSDVTTGLAIAEGIEKSLAILSAGWSPIWCTAGTSTMQSLPVLSGVEHLTIFADGDDAGQAAALKCADRWTGALHHVTIRTPRGAKDWDDVLQAAA